MAFIKLYLITLFLFLVIDFLWLCLIAKNLYKEQIGFLLSESPRWGAVILFYCIYAFGLMFFVISPAIRVENYLTALTYGALFGFICYAAYDLTNLATLRGWPVKLVIYDLIWGAFISGVTSLATFWIGSHWVTSLK